MATKKKGSGKTVDKKEMNSERPKRTASSPQGAKEATGARAPRQPRQNGVTRPKPDTLTGRVWEIADKLTSRAKEPVTRSAVLEAFVADGGNPATGVTQYGRWRQFNGFRKESKVGT